MDTQWPRRLTNIVGDGYSEFSVAGIDDVLYVTSSGSQEWRRHTEFDRHYD